MRILLAEDSSSNRLLMQAYLKPTPHRLDLAENGEIAVEMFQVIRYDLVFMDMEMPAMDGYCATRKIREYEREAGLFPVTIVALTAHTTEDEKQKTLSAGCTAYLAKPIKKNTLLAVVAAYASSLTAAIDRRTPTG